VTLDYKKFLGKSEEMVLPYLGGGSVDLPGRRLRLTREVTAGWWRFSIKGRDATPEAPADPPSEVLEKLPAVRGHMCGTRLVHAGATSEDVHLMPEEEPPRFAPVKTRRWHSGDLLFDALEFEGDAEETVRRALEEGRSIHDVKGVSAALRAAFGYALADVVSRRLQIPARPLELRGKVLAIADGGVPAAEAALRHLADERDLAARAERVRVEDLRRAAELAARAARAAHLPPPAVPPAGFEEPERFHIWTQFRRIPEDNRRDRDDAPRRAERALRAAGAEMSSSRRLAEGLLEVTYRFQGERFISIVNATTLQVMDAGVCLAGADAMVTLESLPAVIREAIDEGSLVITRHEGYD
jgi:hypothetical protein